MEWLKRAMTMITKNQMRWPSSTNRGTALLKFLHQRTEHILVEDSFVAWFVDEATLGDTEKAVARTESVVIISNCCFSVRALILVSSSFLGSAMEAYWLSKLIPHQRLKGFSQLI